MFSELNTDFRPLTIGLALASLLLASGCSGTLSRSDEGDVQPFGRDKSCDWMRNKCADGSRKWCEDYAQRCDSTGADGGGAVADAGLPATDAGLPAADALLEADSGAASIDGGGSTASPTTIEGFGARALGHKGCAASTTYRVTTLADSGSGSFREAVSKGCRRVVFDVGGTITLTDDLDIEVSYLTIDGATAPPPGITIKHPNIDYKVVIKAGDGDVHDIIVRYLRNAGLGGHGETSQDFWGFNAKGDTIYNVALDHLTMTASNDGIFDFAHEPGRVAYKNITISWSLIHTQSRATSIRGVKGISYHHNVMARIDDRQPKMTGDTEADYVNNVTYNWGYICHRSTVAGLSLDSDETVDPKVIARNSVFKAVSNKCGDNAERALWYQGGVGGSKLYTSGNIFPSAEKERGNVTSPPFTVPSWAQVTTYAASTLGDTVVPCAGTVYPTTSERALLSEISKAIGGKGGSCTSAP